jgi:hypothetical protein
MRPKLSELIVDGYFCNGGQWVKYGVDDICPLSQSGIYVGSDMPQLNRARRLGAGGALQYAALLFLLLCALPTTAQNTLTVLIFGTATVTSSPAGISCTVTGGTGCSANLPSGAVTLSETPGTGQTFYGWTGGCTGSGLTCTFSLTANTAVGAVFQCGPPIYPCSATTKSPVGTLTPSFSTSTPFNTVVFSPLNPTLDPITRFIDRNVVQYGTSTNLSTAISSGNLTVSGSDNDLNTSLHAQYVMVRANGGPNWIFQTSTLNGAMQNATNGGENPSLGVYSPAFSFSRVSEKVFYYFTGSSLQQATIVPGTPMTDTVTANASFPFNIDNCPAAGTGTPTWLSFLGVAANDSVFMFAAAWTGGQGYGHLVFAYSPTLGCSTLDLAPNGTSSVSGNWYTWCTSNCSAATKAGTETACYDPYYATGSGIHDVYTGQDGTLINIDGGCWNGNTIESQAFWQINTGNVLSGIGNETIGGHKSVGYTHILYTNDPTPNSRTISPLTTGNLAAYTNMTAPPTYGASGSGGYHGGWPSDLNTNDLNYWIYETACSPSGYECANYLTPNAYQNEIFGISPASSGPAIVRFAETYNSGESTYFSCGNGIGFPSQDGQWWFWIADGLLNLGLDGNGKPLCSVFAVHLDSTGPPPPGIYSPVNVSALTSTSATFQWHAYTGATAYWLDIGSTQGGNNYYSSGSLSTSTFSETVTTLPSNGSTVYATWYYLLNGTWTPTDYSYTALGGNSSQGAITSPVPSSTLTGSSVAFTWTAGSGATAYWIDVGSTSGGNNYYSSGNLGNVLTQTVNGLPSNGSAVYVTLYSLVGGVWLSNAYTYTAPAFNAASGAGAMTSPANGSTLSGSSVAFNWTAGAGATAYWIDVGSTSGGNNYYSSGNLGNVLTQTVNGLPTNGSAVYVTLYSSMGGAWQSNPYTYTAFSAASGAGVITSPANGSTLSGSSVAFNWTAGSGASAYWLDVGSSAGGNNYYSSGNLGNVLTVTVNGLPTNGSTVYATLYSLISGNWTPNAYTYTGYTLAGAAGGVITTPASGSTLSGSSVTFDWTAGAGASAYWLDVGNTAGGNNYYSSGNLGNVLTTTVNGLPMNGSTIYVTLYSLISGAWSGNAYTYTALTATGGLAAMTSPVPGTTLSGTTVTFTWSSDSSATAYWVDIGSTAGGNDVYSSGNLGTALTTTVSTLPANGNTIYVSLYSYVGGQWLNNPVTYISGP